MFEVDGRTWASRIREEGQLVGERQPRFRSGAPLAASLARLLEAITAPERLAEIGEWPLACQSSEDLLARVRGVPSTGARIAQRA